MNRDPDRKWLGDFNFMTYNSGAKGSQYHRNCDPYLNQQLESESDLELAQQTLEEVDTLFSNAFSQVSARVACSCCMLITQLQNIHSNIYYYTYIPELSRPMMPFKHRVTYSNSNMDG